MINIENVYKTVLDNPLIISLFVYIIICVIIYFTKPDTIFGDNESSDDDNKTERFFKNNIKIIFIILPFIIYGLVCIASSLITRKSYCELLKDKELNIKNLLKKCKR